VHLEGLVRREPEALQVELDEARLRVLEVEVDRDQDDVAFFLLRINQQLRIVDVVEAQAPVALQGGIRLPHTVQQRDQLAQAVGAPEVPALHLVLLRVEVLLASGLAGRVLEELVRRPVDAVVRGERRGEHRPYDERRPPARLQRLVQDVGRVGPHVGPEILARRIRGELSEIFG